MPELTLQIIAEEIKGGYLDGRDCAITKALARAGRPDLMDCGTYISYKGDFGKLFISEDTNKSYKELSNKVVRMYLYSKAENFTHTLIY